MFQIKNTNPGRYIRGVHPSVLVVPRASKTAFSFKNGFVPNTGVYAQENPNSALARATVGTISVDVDPACESGTFCERSITQELCDCGPFVPVGGHETIFGISKKQNTACFSNYISNALHMTFHPWYARINPRYIRNASIIFPCMGAITGHIAKTVNLTETHSSILEIYGDFPGFYNGEGRPNDKIMSHDLQWADATQELDPIIDPTRPGIINIVDIGASVGSNPMKSLATLHLQNRSHIVAGSQVYPKKTLTFDINGSSFGPLIAERMLTPASGLTSWSISYGAGGVKNSFTFATRPRKLPKKEEIISKIETRFRPL